MAIGKNIRYHREERLKWTLEQLSERSGVDVGTISALEVRDSSRSKFFSKIAEALGMTTADLEMDPEKFKASAKKESGSFTVAGMQIKPIEQILLDNYRGMKPGHREALEQMANALYLIDNPRDKIAAGRDTNKKEKNGI